MYPNCNITQPTALYHNGTYWGLKQIHYLKLKTEYRKIMNYKWINNFIYQNFPTNKIIFIQWIALKEIFQSVLFIPKTRNSFLPLLKIFWWKLIQQAGELYWMKEILQYKHLMLVSWRLELEKGSVSSNHQSAFVWFDISRCMEEYIQISLKCFTKYYHITIITNPSGNPRRIMFS